MNLPALGKAEMLGKLLDAAASGAPVYLDAMDFAARLEPAVYEILRECLTTAEAGSCPVASGVQASCLGPGARRSAQVRAPSRSGSCGSCR